MELSEKSDNLKADGTRTIRTFRNGQFGDPRETRVLPLTEGSFLSR
jgi:hypothetical protein